MKRLLTFLILSFCISFIGYAQVKIGLPAGAPQASSVLDLSNIGDGTRGFSLPRVANTASIVTPVNGMLIYDLSTNCTKVYDNGVWSGCLSTQPAPSSVGVNCTTSAINGNYNQGTALTASNTITIIMINNTQAALTITPTTSDIALSDVAAAGMVIASVSPASVSPAAGGGTSTITYTLSGTPTTAGSFTATFTKLGLSCVKTGNVCATIVPITVSNTTTPATLPIPSVNGNTINYTAAGGTPNSSLTWSMTSSPAGLFSNVTSGTGAIAQAILNDNVSGLVTVTYSALNACGVTVTGTKGVAVSDLTVNNTSSAINGNYLYNSALTAANTVTIVLVNYSPGAKTITPLNADIVLSGAGAAGMSVTSFSPASVSVAANGGTSTITYNLTGTPTALGSFTATWTKVGLSLAKTNTVCTSITPITISTVINPGTLPNPIVDGNTITFTGAGGTPNASGMSWTMTSIPSTGVFSNPSSGTGNTAQAILVAGATTGAVTVTFTASNACAIASTSTYTMSLYDNLRSALNAGGCTSCVAYDAAAADTWVQITAAEYAQIDNFLSVNLAAGNETVMASPAGSFNPGYALYSSGTNNTKLPANNYVVAFSAIQNSGSSNNNAYLKYSNSAPTGFSMSGPSLKLANTSGRVYNIMKKPSAVINASAATTVGIYSGPTDWLGFATTGLSGSIYNYVNGDGSAISSVGGLSNACMQYQVKGTTIKKW